MASEKVPKIKTTQIKETGKEKETWKSPYLKLEILRKINCFDCLGFLPLKWGLIRVKYRWEIFWGKFGRESEGIRE